MGSSERYDRTGGRAGKKKNKPEIIKRTGRYDHSYGKPFFSVHVYFGRALTEYYQGTDQSGSFFSQGQGAHRWQTKRPEYPLSVNRSGDQGDVCKE